MSDLQRQLEIRDMVDIAPVREKLLELKHWEKRMKAKEKERQQENNNNPTEGTVFPPVRSRIKALNGINGDCNINGRDERLETNGDPKQEESTMELDEQKKEAAKNSELANSEKERGNKLVSVKDYANAIPHYTKAIEYNAKDPAFFMNRALCYLRMEQYSLAIADCDSALSFDKSLTKAHFRRMQSNTRLMNYDAALGDCIQMIKLDPGNPDLRKEFDRIKQLKLDKEGGGGGSKIPEAAKTPEEPYWEPRPKKLWSKFGEDVEEIKFQDKPPHLRSQKPLKRIPILETFSTPDPVETFPDHIVDKLFNNFTGESTSNGPAASSSRSPTALFSPYTPLYGSFNAAKSPMINTPQSPISSSAMNLSSCSADRSIDDIFGGMNVVTKPDSKSEETETLIGPMLPEAGFQLTDEVPPLTNCSEILTEVLDKTDVMKPVPSQPPTEFNVPRTGVQFANTWKSLEEGQRFHYLRQLQEKSEIIGKLGASLDDSLLTELLDCLNSYFCPKDLNIGDILLQLSANSEMGILSLMMGYNERRTVEDLLGYIRSRKELPEEVCVRIENVFTV